MLDTSIFIVNSIRNNLLLWDDEVNASYTCLGSILVQFQDRESHEVRATRHGINRHPKVSTHTWARVWDDEKLIFSCELPKYQARQKVIEFLINY